MSSPHTEIIAREGWRYLLVAFLLLLGAYYLEFGNLIKLLLFVGFLTLLFFFRNPERVADDDSPGTYLAPIDGTIAGIENKHVGSRQVIVISIANDLTDVHQVRAPADATVTEIWRRHGIFLPTASAKAAALNEKALIKLRTGRQHLEMEMLASRLGEKIGLYPENGEKLKSGQRLGFLFSGRLDLVLPAKSELKIAIGDDVKAGKSVIGFARSGNDA